MRFTIEDNTILKVETDKETIYLQVRAMSGSDGDAHYVDIQATDPKGKVRIIELSKVYDLPKGWARSSSTRLKKGYRLV
jgi:ribulose bisphosphate carboxylase small subunit